MRSRLAAVAALFALGLLGCTGGGPSTGTQPPAQPTSPPATAIPSLQVLPSSFDFGRVTTGNAPLVAPLEITVRNAGTGPLSISQIAAPATAGFAVSSSGGSRPCGPAVPTTVAAGDYCTVEVSFQPNESGTFTSAVNVVSNGGSVGVPIMGTAEAVSSLTVRINQLDASCASDPNATAYVSVTDQGGFPVLGLTAASFAVAQPPSTANLLLSASYVEAVYRPLAIAAALDHSSSLTDQPVAFSDMKRSVADFFGQLRTGDIGEVVNFDSAVEVVQPFTSDRNLLQAAVLAPWDRGGSTLLYDAIYRGIEDASSQTSYRRAVVVTTDGINTATAPRTLDEVIGHAVGKKVAVFAVGIGSTIDVATLQRLADETGGVFYRANVSQNLETIYRQLSSVLFEKQYVLKFNQLPRGSPGVASPVTVSVVGPTGLTGTAPVVNIASCN